MMKRVLVTVAVILAISLAVGATPTLADGGKGVAVKPLTPKPGEMITVKGDRLGRNKIEIRVIGRGVDVDLGEVDTNAEGDFRTELRLPADLPPGTYTVRAKGAETAETEITVLAATGNLAPAAPTTGVGMTQVRERPLAETIGLVALFGVVAAAGLFFARTAGRRVTS